MSWNIGGVPLERGVLYPNVVEIIDNKEVQRRRISGNAKQRIRVKDNNKEINLSGTSPVSKTIQHPGRMDSPLDVLAEIRTLSNAFEAVDVFRNDEMMGAYYIHSVNETEGDRRLIPSARQGARAPVTEALALGAQALTRNIPSGVQTDTPLTVSWRIRLVEAGDAEQPFTAIPTTIPAPFGPLGAS